MVHVPVDDRDALEPAGLTGVVSSDRRVAEDAEAHPRVGDRVMAGRPDERVAVRDGAIEHGVDRRDRAARRAERDLERARAERRQAARITPALGRELTDPLDVLARVEAADLVDRGIARLHVGEL